LSIFGTVSAVCLFVSALTLLYDLKIMLRCVSFRCTLVLYCVCFRSKPDSGCAVLFSLSFFLPKIRTHARTAYFVLTRLLILRFDSLNINTNSYPRFTITSSVVCVSAVVSSIYQYNTLAD
jgi:hypothetical protein